MIVLAIHLAKSAIFSSLVFCSYSCGLPYILAPFCALMHLARCMHTTKAAPSLLVVFSSSPPPLRRVRSSFVYTLLAWRLKSLIGVTDQFSALHGTYGIYIYNSEDAWRILMKRACFSLRRRQVMTTTQYRQRGSCPFPILRRAGDVEHVPTCTAFNVHEPNDGGERSLLCSS